MGHVCCLAFGIEIKHAGNGVMFGPLPHRGIGVRFVCQSFLDGCSVACSEVDGLLV